MLLTFGVLLWAVVHLSSALAPGSRAAIIQRIGLWPYKGLYALLLVAALVLIVLGWQALSPTPLYASPAGMRHITQALMPIAIILFISARAPSDIKQFIRHSQLAGVKLWAVAHLLSNADARALILFGGLLAWAVLEVICINRRDGAWVKPAPVGVGKTLLSVAVGLLLTVLLAWAHPWFSGGHVVLH